MPKLNENIAEMVGVLIGDGCISRYQTKEGRIRTFLLFSGHSQNDVGYKVNKITKVDEVYVLRITHQEYVRLFMDDFSINHPYHLGRFRDIVLPPKASDS